MDSQRRPGRPPGESSTRDRVLAAAAESFLSRGYGATTIRGIAETVGIDPATVVHHGGRKHELFTRSMMLQVAPAGLLHRALSMPRREVPVALARVVVLAWSDEAIRRPVELVLATALTQPRVREMCRDYLEREVVQPLALFIGGRDATARATAVAALVAGTMTTRYALGIGRDLPLDEPMASLAPTLHQLLLRSPLPKPR